jgi:hypothetical protein
MAVCKAIGETGNPAGASFLLEKVERAQGMGSRIPMLAGLSVFRLKVDKSRVVSLLKAPLDREEIILLSKLRTNFSGTELVVLYHGRPRERTYALEYIFRMPEANFEALQTIVEEMIARHEYKSARELMMSDRIRRSTDDRIRKFRESVLNRVRQEKI